MTVVRINITILKHDNAVFVCDVDKFVYKNGLVY